MSVEKQVLFDDDFIWQLISALCKGYLQASPKEDEVVYKIRRPGKK